MVYEISITAEFSAAHQLRLYDGSLEPLHGHNWRVVVTVAANRLDEIGVVMDFHELERRLQHVVGRFHNQNLNDVIPFVEVNPSAEKVAEYIATTLPLPERVRLCDVVVHETEQNWARIRVD